MPIKELSESKRIAVNIIAAAAAALANACVGFFLSPYIVETIGVEAQGYVQLASNFTTYAAMITAALNSMAGRFITIAVSQGDKENADKYYSSVFYGNIVVVAAMLIPVVLFILNLGRIIDIPDRLISDGQLLFGLVFFRFFVSTIFSIWNNTFYITNRTYLHSSGNTLSALITAVTVFILFAVLPPKMYYSSVAGVGALVFMTCWSSFYKKRLLPELEVAKHSISLSHLKSVVSSGIWYTFQSVGEMLLRGLDLLICNILLNPEMMGVLALSKTLPTVLAVLNSQIAATFAPQLTIKYADGNNSALLPELRKACKITAILGTIPVAGLLVYGHIFFQLWVPSQDPVMLHRLSVLACAELLVISGMRPVVNIFATVNKVKTQAISVIISGAISTIIVLILLGFSVNGVYVIAGTSTVILIARNAIYTMPIAAKCLGCKWNTFFFGFGYSLLGSATVIAVGYVVKQIIQPDSWTTLILSGIITGLFGLALNALLLCNKIERQWLMAKIRP